VGRVRSRGKLVRLIEGRPFVARHETQQNRKSVLWKNHGGTNARVLGTIPLAADGSFFMEVPADRLLQLQVLDSDRRVLGNQLFWMYARPGETRSGSRAGCLTSPRNGTEQPVRSSYWEDIDMTVYYDYTNGLPQMGWKGLSITNKDQ
jgi:hypothetical protein